MKDTQSRKWQLTINNPLEKNLSHVEIKKNLESLTSITYWALCDEIGLEESTPHTHIFIYSPTAIKFSTLKNKFSTAHIECCKGSCQQNVDYIKKDGKYKNDPKTKTNLSDTYEEFGEMPIERQGARNDIADLYDMILSGMSDGEILSDSPQYMLNIDKIAKARQAILSDKWRTTWRDLEVIYIYGETRTGKTRYVMDKYGYTSVYRVTDYEHPFDNYNCEPVILFEEFRSSLRIENMLKYLEGYPLVLPARYVQKQACYTKVYIISNIPLNEQYTNIQTTQKSTWRAFIARFGGVLEFDKNGKVEMTVQNHLDKNSQFGIYGVTQVYGTPMPF
jgi:hypothetical protein